MTKAGFSEVCLNENVVLFRGGGFLPSKPVEATLDNLYSSAFAEKARQGELKVPDPEKAAVIYRNNLLHRRLKTSDHNPVILSVLRVGDVIFATNPAELFVEFQLEMRQKLEGKILLACSCTNGHAFYVPTRKAHAFGGYETLVCQLDPDAGEKIVAATIALVNLLENG